MPRLYGDIGSKPFRRAKTLVLELAVEPSDRILDFCLGQ
jgi:hypothetical protein